jgi:hypothetical protein
MPISPTEHWLAGVVFKTDKICSHYNIKTGDHLCWPVLLTQKKGEAALEICPDSANHGDLKQPCHKRPAKFDLKHIYDNFTRAATPAENKKAGWSSKKKTKA